MIKKLKWINIDFGKKKKMEESKQLLGSKKKYSLNTC